MAEDQRIDFVIMGLQSWDIDIGSNCKNIAVELAKSHRVLYVNRALDRISMMRGRNNQKVRTRLHALRHKGEALQQVQENLWVLNPTTILESINWITSRVVFDYFNKINGQRLSRSINQSITTLGFKCVVLFIDNDFVRGRYLKELIENEATAYYLRDFLTNQPYFKRHGPRLERTLLQMADVVFANSSYLAQYASQYQSHAFDVGQGCDLTAFSGPTPEIPNDLRSLKRPTIGYVGALLSSRLDIDLIDEIAQCQPDWNIVLVGPQDRAFSDSVLYDRDNVHFLGEKEGEQVPAYIYGFDVCINPQAVNAMTQGNYPRKIDEYLAAGKPVVATATEAMQLFAPYVHLAQEADGYVSCIQRALHEVGDRSLRERRKKFAFTHTWEESVSKMKQQLFSVDHYENEAL